jgi:hypothetical protein
MPGIQQLTDAVLAIQRGLDLAGHAAWFVGHNVDTVLTALHLFLFATIDPFQPGRPFTAVGPVQEFTPLVQAAADAALLAALTWAFLRLMWSHGFRNKHTLRVLLPRAGLAALLINFALPLVQGAVDTSNALCDSIALATRNQAILAVKGDFMWDLAAPGLYAVTMVILFIAYLLLGFVYVVRFALLVVLTILAPAAALLFVLPETHHYTRLWSSLFISTLLMQPLQLLILAIGFGLDHYGHVPVRHLFALASVYIVFKVPGALHTTSMVASRASSFARREVTHAVHVLAKA